MQLFNKYFIRILKSGIDCNKLYDERYIKEKMIYKNVIKCDMFYV